MGQHYQAKYEQLSSLQKQKGTIFVSLGLGKGRYFGKKIQIRINFVSCSTFKGDGINWFMSEDVTSNHRGIESPDLEFKIEKCPEKVNIDR